MKTFHGIGIMSGTSLDGLDLAYCIFTEADGNWSFSIEKAETIPYSQQWRTRLTGLLQATKEEILLADTDLGEYIGEVVRRFIGKHALKVDFVASHGHTIFHQPEKKLTLQIGNGHAIADICGTKVINDFRSQDVEMGGQGAPLVPIGDRLLFGEYDYCLNLGGIANISYEKDGERIAYDICPANMVLNMLAGRLGKPYDDKGRLAGQGEPILSLMQKLESLDYYHQSPPKSLGREWVETNIFPLLNHVDTRDLLASFVEHIAMLIGDEVKGQGKKMLVTGGGAFNIYLLYRLADHCETEIFLPNKRIIDYKEALVFAFLGLLRLEGINNVLASVTGAGEDHCAGEIIEP